MRIIDWSSDACSSDLVMHKTLLGALSATAVFVSMPAVAQDAPPPAAQDPAPQAESTDGDIVVTGVRQSLERAAEVKRNATQVVDSIVATDIGKLPDQIGGASGRVRVCQ